MSVRSIRPQPQSLPIYRIQGRGELSPYAGQNVTTDGVITALQPSGRSPGFFMQDMKGDGDAATSDGVFVATDAVTRASDTKYRLGQPVSVTGRVSEDVGLTTIVAENKQITRAGRLVDELPAPAELQPPPSVARAASYLEARESMLTTVPNAMVLDATSRYGEFVAVSESSHGPQKDRDTSVAGRRVTVSGRLGHNTQLSTGDRPIGVFGPLSFDPVVKRYQVLQSQPYKDVDHGPYPPKQWGDLDGDDRIAPSDVKGIRSRIGSAAQGPLDAADVNGDGRITRTDADTASQRARSRQGGPSFQVASYNLENLFDLQDDPQKDDMVPTAKQYHQKLTRIAGTIRQHLGGPTLLALQEVENTTVLSDLAKRPELKDFNYKFELLPGADARGINVALMYRGDSVKVHEVRQAQKRVDLDDGAVMESDDVLFARPPLIADVTVTDGKQSTDLTLIVNHLKSKMSPLGAPTEPRRIEQAKFLAKLVDEHRRAHPDREVVVIGDLNDHERSRSLRELTGTGDDKRMVNVGTAHIPKGERYTYNYLGTSEMIDHILVTPGLGKQVDHAGVRHFNADLPESARWSSNPYGGSDHDVPYARFRFAPPAEQAHRAGRATARRSKQTAHTQVR